MRSSLIRVFVVLLLLAAAVAPPVEAGYWKGEVYYYSSSSKAYVIGYFVRYCDNSTSSWGQTSAWADHYDFDCGPVEP